MKTNLVLFGIVAIILTWGAYHELNRATEISTVKKPKTDHKYFMVDGMQCIQIGTGRSRAVSCNWSMK